jgi:hypothetical protein
MSKPIIYLDIDDVIFSWQEAYACRFNTKILKSWSTSNLVKKRLDVLSKEKDFWLNLPLKNIPNFQPNGFISARGIPKKWTYESLKNNNIPGRSNLHQVYWGQSKIQKLKDLGVDILIDDNPKTFKECEENGIFCILMTMPYNTHIKTKYRVDNLDINNILNLWDDKNNSGKYSTDKTIR